MEREDRQGFNMTEPGARIEIDGEGFLINGKPTYMGRWNSGRRIEGLLFNSRMIQAVFDDENPETRELWKYPDTGVWDADRNTDEFIKALPSYKEHGLLAVTVGLQGGGAVFRTDVYNSYVNSAFTPDGELKDAYFSRLGRIIRAADALGMIVIVNYFYIVQTLKIPECDTIRSIVEKTTARLLELGNENILVEVLNECGTNWPFPELRPEGIHELIDIVKQTTLKGRRFLVGCSQRGGNEIELTPSWLASEDFNMPHGNGQTPDGLREKIRGIRATDEYRRRPRPILFNEDSVFVENMDAAGDEYASWGFYCQGYGSAYRDRFDWTIRDREDQYAKLSGFQTVPVNWSINTDVKRTFFDRLREVTRD